MIDDTFVSTKKNNHCNLLFLLESFPFRLYVVCYTFSLLFKPTHTHTQLILTAMEKKKMAIFHEHLQWCTKYINTRWSMHTYVLMITGKWFAYWLVCVSRLLWFLSNIYCCDCVFFKKMSRSRQNNVCVWVFLYIKKISSNDDGFFRLFFIYNLMYAGPELSHLIFQNKKKILFFFSL